MKFLCSAVIVLMLAFAGGSYAGEAGIAEVPQNVIVGAGNVVSAAVAPVQGVFQPSSGCAYAPYEVTVEYTPIQPQPGTCTYCTVLPYGCPDGAPLASSGICGGTPATSGGGLVCAIEAVISAPFDLAQEILGCFNTNRIVCN